MKQSKTKTTASGRADKRVAGKVVINSATKKGAAAVRVRFGSVVASATSPKQVELRRNVNTGQAALARATTKIVKAGVSIPARGSVPLYRADPQDPTRLIRELNGKTSTGIFVDGRFKVSTK